jgi:3'-phosphoadenosine 5'-phosphosulfate sulfotransferase (PAPS reductase)/FAD synthetase
MSQDNKFTNDDLKKMQSWDFYHKIGVTQTRIQEWYYRFDGNVSVSLSGGKDSTVLLHIARRCFPDIEAVFVDTGLELPEVREFALSLPNVTVLKPQFCKVCTNCVEGCYPKVLRKYGWCFPNKNVADALYYARKGSPWAVNDFLGIDKEGNPSKYKERIYKRWAFLLDSDFVLSSKCCDIIKERPLDLHQKKTGKQVIVGTMACESDRRRVAWMKTGCNAFDSKKKISKPLSFWTEQDILRYLRDFNVPYASVYGDIVEDKNHKLHLTGLKRTGCCFCPVGCHLDKFNRFQYLKQAHPELYDYCINGLGLGKFLDFVGVKYE